MTDHDTLVPFQDWAKDVKDAIDSKNMTAGKIFSLVLERVRVQDEHEWNCVQEIKLGLIADLQKAVRDPSTELFSKSVTLAEEVRGWRRDFDSPMFQDFIAPDEPAASKKFLEKYIYSDSKPSEALVSAFVRALTAAGGTASASLMVTTDIVRSIGISMEEIRAADNVFDKYVAGRKLDFLRSFMENWNGNQGSTFFSVDDLGTIKKETETLRPIFEVMDRTGDTVIFPIDPPSNER